MRSECAGGWPDPNVSGLLPAGTKRQEAMSPASGPASTSRGGSACAHVLGVRPRGAGPEVLSRPSMRWGGGVELRVPSSVTR